jgi:hypothetical protein
MSNIVYDGSVNCRHGDIHGALIRDGGTTRDYRQVLHLNNDIRGNLEAEVEQHIQVRKGTSHIETDKATISFWIRPTGMSADNAGIVFNNAGPEGLSHGVVLSVNGNAYTLGYNWKNQKTSHNVDLGVILEYDKWSFVVVMIYPTGIVRVFLNNVYVQYYDLGVRHELVTFDNLEIGRFSGMIDDVKFYSDTLYYGKVSYEEQAQSYVRALYESSRVPGEQPTSVGLTSRKPSEFDFYYAQSPEFMSANLVYTNLAGKSDTLEEERKQQFVLNLGEGESSASSKLAFATDKFTSIAGNLTGRFVEV